MLLDALVIGAGPAGSTISALLAGSGWSVGIAEAAAFPRRKVCGEYLSPTNFPLFEELNFAERFVELAGPEIRRVGIFSDDLELISAFPRNKRLANPWGRALRREVLDAELLRLAIANGATVWQPFTAARVARNSDGFVTTLKSTAGELVEVPSRLVIAAHGSWKIGPLPTQQRRLDATPTDLFAFKAHFKDTSLPEELMPMIVFPGGYGGLVTTDGGFMSISACIERSMLDALRQASGTKDLGAIFEDHVRNSIPALSRVLKGSRRVGKWLTAGVVRPGGHARATDGILAVGNAAGESHPIVAEGISMAIQGAGLLYDVLKTLPPEAIDEARLESVSNEYDRRWRRTLGARIGFAETVARAAFSERSRPLLTMILRRFPGLLTTGARLSGKARPMV